MEIMKKLINVLWWVFFITVILSLLANTDIISLSNKLALTIATIGIISGVIIYAREMLKLIKRIKKG